MNNYNNVTSIDKLYKELNIGVYYSTWRKRIIQRYNLEEGIDYFIDTYNNNVYLNNNVYEHIKNTYSKSKKLKDISYISNDAELQLYNSSIIDNNYNTSSYVTDMIEENKYKIKIKDLVKDNKKLLEELERLNDFRDTYVESFNIQPTDIKYNRRKESDEYITPIITFSDWHIGSIIKPSYVNGINKYNLEIATNRITYATEKFINHYKNMQNYEIDKIVVCCLGDLIQGELHGTTIEFGVPKQVIEAYNILSYQLKLIKEAFTDKEIEIYFVSGNHSYHRTNEHKYGKNFDVFYNSYESIIAHNLINEGYTVYTSEYNELVANINGLRLLIIHGNEHKVNINNKNSIYNNLDKKKKQFMDFNNDYFDVCLQGHLHQSYYSDTLIIADAPVGLDSYASKNLNINNGKGPGVTTFCITDMGEISNYKVIRVGHIK